MARTGRIVHTVFHSIFFALSTVGAGLLVLFALDLVASYAQKSTAAEEDLFGIGLGIAILTVFIVIGAIATAVFSAVSVLLSAFIIKKSVGKRRVWGIVSTSLSGAYILCSGLSVLFAVIAA